ncbi:uncharacterized protein LOC130496899 isoform X2 [Raphanus sativus]|uniref:Uncharacterized protein LOC108811814 isoform X2 n=1 Tax=Raphanus sativus TaxID=3726 RepID=A0A9W3C205_RAPSA|nr:uncharacterized protein LOC108811814 isoform X2 [Raphanus sativus]XP_056845524.1 uncharacterized protein LOC130496899 isoform X2 [Raphanus sativus]
MPLTKLVPDAFGVLTICLVALLILLGLLCIAYSFYFHSHARKQGFIQLGYFTGPWIVRITFILFSFWWAVGEIFRLSLFRRHTRLLSGLDLRWQENVCKWYIVSNLGFAEPCLFLTLMFLLRAPLKIDSGALSGKWNRNTACYIILYSLPMLALQLALVLSESRLNGGYVKLSSHFTRTYSQVTIDHAEILKLVINKRLQKRVHTLIFSVFSFLPLRIAMLCLSVLAKADKIVFEALSFLAFLSLFCFCVVSICLLVYFPVSDSMALRGLRDMDEDDSRGVTEERSGALLLAPHNEDSLSLRGRRSSSQERYVELSLFLEAEN